MIPEEGIRSSTGLTHTITSMFEEDFLVFLPSFRGMIFNISTNEPSCSGETPQESAKCVERNANCAACKVDRDNANDARAATNGMVDITSIMI
jgi:hypothetical protein